MVSQAVFDRLNGINVGGPKRNKGTKASPVCQHIAEGQVGLVGVSKLRVIIHKGFVKVKFASTHQFHDRQSGGADFGDRGQVVKVGELHSPVAGPFTIGEDGARTVVEHHLFVHHIVFVAGLEADALSDGAAGLCGVFVSMETVIFLVNDPAIFGNLDYCARVCFFAEPQVDNGVHPSDQLFAADPDHFRNAVSQTPNRRTGNAHSQREFFVDRHRQFALEGNGSKHCLRRSLFQVIGELVSHNHCLGIVQSRDFIQSIRVAKKHNDALAACAQDVQGFEVAFGQTVFCPWADVLQVHPDHQYIVVLGCFLYV